MVVLAALLSCITMEFLNPLITALAASALNGRKELLRLTSKIPAQAGQASQVNASVYELYSPPGEPSMEVLFFHGFQNRDYKDAHFSTWTCRDGSSLWPQTWLVDKFCDARILSVSYNATVLKSRESGTIDMYIIGENLTSDLLDANIGQEPCRPVVLVGHSFGGLVIKQLCAYASSETAGLQQTSERNFKLTAFLENVKGIFFYSTPHYGIADDIAEQFVAKGPLLDYVKTLSTPAARLNFHFDNLCGQDGRYKMWQISGLGESLPTKWGRFHDLVVVKEASSRYGTSFNIVEGADHISICRPTNKTCRSFYSLTSFLERVAIYSKAMVYGLPDYPTALRRRVFKVQQMLTNSPVVGIVGMGGVGKSTIAKELFNTISGQFEYICFVHNVKGISIHELYDWIPSHCLRNGNNVDQKSLRWSDLQKKKTLIIMDDVDSGNQIKTLPRFDQFRNGSRLIFTTRDQGVLSTFPNCVIYKVDILDSNEAKKLFCQHAFEQEGIPQSLIEINHHLEAHVAALVEKCDGLPLALEVVGSYLRGHKTNANIWKETLDKLRKAQPVDGVRNDRLWAALRLSYDALCPEEQGMFIEAGTYFFGQPVHRALAAWSTTYGHSESRWANLLRTSMVKEVCYTKRDDLWVKHMKHRDVQMHDLLRDLANYLSGGATVTKYVTSGSHFNAAEVEGHTTSLKLNAQDAPDYPNIQLESLDKLEDLKYLELFQFLPEESSSNLSTKLSLIEWCSKDLNIDYAKLPTLPISLEGMNDVAVLKLKCWTMSEESVEALGWLSNLRILSLTHIDGELRLPEEFCYLSHLKRLELRSIGMTALPRSFGNLSALEHLLLYNLAVVELPESFGNLRSLKTLLIRDCQQLTSLPQSFGRLSSLEDLCIVDCTVLNCPEFTELRQIDLRENLSALESLCLRRCASLERLPASFGLLPSLESLGLDNCHRLKALPESIGQFKALKKMRIYDNYHLETLPDSFGNLSALTFLQLHLCRRLERLPKNFGNLSALIELEVRCCYRLQRLPANFGQLRALEKLFISAAENLEALSDDFGKLASLTTMCVEVCGRLERLPESFGFLFALNSLELKDCGLQSLPDTFGQLRVLEKLIIKNASKLEALSDDFGTLASLQTLCIEVCGHLERLPESFGVLSALKSLELRDCGLHSLPGTFGQLRALEKLIISEAYELEALSDDFGKLASLKTLSIEDCGHLERLPESFGFLSALESLELNGCLDLQGLPDTFGQLSALTSLQIFRCYSIERLPESFGSLSALQTLELEKCGLSSLPGTFGQLSALTSLHIQQCGFYGAPPLESLENLSSSLQDFTVGGDFLYLLPETIGQFHALRSLAVRVPGLWELPNEVGDLSSLEMFAMESCPDVETLPDSLGRISSLKKVIVRKCQSLKSLPDTLGLFFSPNGDRSTETSRAVGGQSSQIASRKGFRLFVHLCDFLDDSVLQRLGWIQSEHPILDSEGTTVNLAHGGMWYRRKRPGELQL